MNYFIDAYNLLFRFHDTSGSLQSKRQKLIEELNEKSLATSASLTLIFDAISQYGEATRSQHDALSIIYTGEGISADDHIIEELDQMERPQNITVVTSDNQLAWRARQRGAKSQSVEQFIAWLNKKWRHKEKRASLQPKHPRLSPAPLSPPAPLPHPPPPPGKEELPHACYNYYLWAFETPTSPTAASSPMAPPPPPSTQASPLPPSSSPPHQEDAEYLRWLQLFETPPEEL